MGDHFDKKLKTSIYPYVEINDKLGNRYFIDVLSKPLFYFALSYRIYFPVELQVIDENKLDSSLKSVPLNQASDKKRGPLAALSTAMLIGFAYQTPYFLSMFLDVDYNFYRYYFYFAVCFGFMLSYKTAIHVNKTIKKKYNLENMEKIIVKSKFTIKSFVACSVHLLFVLLPFLYKILPETKYTLTEMIMAISAGLMAYCGLINPWRFAEFDFKKIDLK